MAKKTAKFVLLSIILYPLNALLDVSQCDKSVTCFRFPTNCDFSDTSSCSIVSWSSNFTGVHFRISRSFDDGEDSGYAGMAIAESPNMSDGDTYVCQKAGGTDQVDLLSEWIIGKTRPEIVGAGAQDLVVRESLVFDPATNSIECAFYRPDVITAIDSYDYSIYNPGINDYHLLLAAFTWDQQGGQIDYHTTKKTASAEKINFKAEPGDGPSVNARITDGLIIAHGCCMLLAWGIYVKIAVYSASFLKEVEFKRSDAMWFDIHRWLNGAAVVCTIVGVILAFAFNDWEFIGNGPGAEGTRKYHAIFGMSVLSLALANVILGLARPAKDSKLRPYFYAFHAIFGTVALSFGEYCVFTGLLLDRFEVFAWPTYIWAVFLGVHWIFWFYTIFRAQTGKQASSVRVFTIYWVVLGVVYIIEVVGLVVD